MTTTLCPDNPTTNFCCWCRGDFTLQEEYDWPSCVYCHKGPYHKKCLYEEKFCHACFDRQLLLRRPRPDYDPDAAIRAEMQYQQPLPLKRKLANCDIVQEEQKKQQELAPKTLLELAFMPWPDLKPDTLAQKNPHELDSTVYLDETEGKHDYSVKYESGEFECINNLSTSGMVHNYFAEFDDFDGLAAMLNGKQWGPSHPKYGGYYSDDQEVLCKNLVRLLKDWKRKNVEGLQLGKFVHFLAECDMNGVLDLSTKPEYTRTAHIQQYLGWKKTKFEPYYDVYRTELRFRSSSKWRRVGTCDVLAVRKNHPPPSETNGILYVAMFDYKNTIIKTEGFQGKKGFGICAHLDDCNLRHYELQQSDYKKMAAQDIYKNWMHNGHKYSKMCVELMQLVCFDESNPNNEAIVITLQDLDDVIEKMWNQRAEEVAIWETLGRLPIPKKTKPKLTDLETEQRVRELLQKLEAQKQKYVGYQNRYVRNTG